MLFTVVAWAPKGINPQDVQDKSFKFHKLQSTLEGFLSWGFIELTPDQFKRSKPTGRQHLVFHVQSGVVMVKLLENEFVVRAGGVFSCPRGEFPPPHLHYPRLHHAHIFLYT